jgi:hypothetical protein
MTAMCVSGVARLGGGSAGTASMACALASGQAEAAAGDDVALDLARAGGDR